MTSSAYPLGSTVHVHEEKHIQLKAAGSARLYHPDFRYTPLDETRLLEAVRSGDIWLSPHPSFEFKVAVRIDRRLRASATMEEFLSGVADIIGKAKLWSDIHFVVTSQTHGIQNDCGNLNIVLRLQLCSNQSPALRPARLPSSLDALFNASGNVQPPSGILTASVKGIDISLDLLPITPTPKPMGGFPNPHELPGFDPLACPQTGGIFWFQEPNLVGTTEALFLEDVDFQAQDPQEPCLSRQCDEAWQSLDEYSPSSSQNSGVSSASTYSGPKSIDTVFDRFAAISLLDSGFRGIFSAKLSRAHPKIESQVESDATALIDLAPGVFNPKYRTGISHRACFIPSIAKGITSLLSNSDSPLVKSKLQALESSFRENHDRWSGLENYPSGPETKDVIKCLLWKTMHRGLQNPGVAPKLTPLDPRITPTDTEDSALLYSLDDDDDRPLFQNTQESPFDFHNDIDGLEDDEDDILTDHDDYDDQFNDADLDTILLSPNTGAICDNLSDTSSHTSLIYQDRYTPPPPPPSGQMHHFASPDMLPMQTSLPASPELNVLEPRDMDLEFRSSDMEMLGSSSPVPDLVTMSHYMDWDIDMLL